MTEATPLPEATPVSAPFWQALTEHRILVQYSPSLGRYVFYPRTLAPGTLADDLQWHEIDGAGSGYSTELVDVDPADVRIGMRVSPVFCDIPDSGITLLRYRPEPTDV